MADNLETSLSFNESGSSSGGSSSGSGSNQPKKTTPKKYKQKPGGDIRRKKGAGSHTDVWSMKSTSGNSFSMDDSKGNESMTFQHRSGSAIQFNPDGSVHLTTHNGKYEMIFGEERVTVTGANDITVKGDGSMRVYGDYNVTCHKDYNLTVLGDFNVTAKNLNRSIRGNMDTEAKNVNKRVEGSATYNTQGAHVITSSDNMTIASLGGHLSAGAAKDFRMKANKGDMIQQVNKGDLHHKLKDGDFSGSYEKEGGNKVTMRTDDGSLNVTTDGGDMNLESKQNKIQVKAQEDIGLKSSSAGVNVEAQSGDFQVQAGQKVRVTAGSDMQMKSQGTAGFEGSETHVGGTSGTTHVVGQAVNVDPSGGMLNLAGGMGIPMPNMSQLSFNFGDIKGAMNIPQFGTGEASQAQEEPDASSEIDSWR